MSASKPTKLTANPTAQVARKTGAYLPGLLRGQATAQGVEHADACVVDQGEDDPHHDACQERLDGFKQRQHRDIGAFNLVHAEQQSHSGHHQHDRVEQTSQQSTHAHFLGVRGAATDHQTHGDTQDQGQAVVVQGGKNPWLHWGFLLLRQLVQGAQVRRHVHQ